MSRILLAASLACLGVLGLAPLAVMAVRIAPADLLTLVDARTLGLLGRTLLLGGASTLGALAVGLPFGFLVARTDVFGARLLRPLGIVPLLLPPLFLAVAWTALVDVRGATLTILLFAIGTFPLVALFTGRAWERIDRRREEAALLVGGRRAAIEMGFPLVLPSALCGACFAFLFAVNDFALPDFVSSVGPKFSVYADEIMATWQVDHAEGRAVATALPLIALTLAALLPALVLRRRGLMATIQGDFQAPARLELGAWRWPATSFCVGLIALGALVPLGRLLFEAGGGTRGWSVASLRDAFARALELSRDNLASSLAFSLAAATLALPVAFVLGHAIERARHGRFLEVLVVLPIAAPAILFGIGYVALWSGASTADFYASGGLVVALLAGRYLAFPTLVAAGAVGSADRRLEEAAELAGAGPITRLVRVVAPTIRPSLFGAWTLVFVLSMRELDAAILVPAANRTAMFKMFNAVHFGRDDFVAALALLIVFLILLPCLLWSLLAPRRVEVLP